MPAYQPVVIAAKYALRISDLTDADSLQVTCFLCGHDAIVPGSVLHERWPGYTRIINIENHFKCDHCGNRGDNFWNTVRRIE